MKADRWVWMPHAGHLIVGNQCRFHLATFVELRPGEAMANAVLFRAAPDLLDALKSLMVALTPELTGVPKSVPKSSWAGQWDAAETAIAKAEGK
jgi:hypothetical protein